MPIITTTAQTVTPELLPVCTIAFRHSMGLPCAHQIEELLQQNQVLQLDDIHPHWHLKPQIPITMQPLVLDPIVACTRGRPTALLKSKSNGSTRAATTRTAPTRTATTHAATTRAATTGQAASSTRRNASAFEQVGVRTRRQVAGEETGRTA